MDKVVCKIIEENKDIFTSHNTNENQIKELIELLATESSKLTTSNNTATAIKQTVSSTFSSSYHNASVASILTVKSSSSSYSDINIPEDLNKAPDEILEIAKKKMDVNFHINQIKPGDPGYQWNVDVEFDQPQEISEWDLED